MPATPMPEWVLQRRRVIGDRLRYAREHAYLTQEELGERVDLDRRTVARIEAGSSPAYIEYVMLLADALGLRLPELFRD